ncbi:MAG TPA: UDP binding domain-containing protein, partial [Gammaproteobacteria bacterium]|nr:UDP binding domain-containing protein [Gammaproteobacteria bacterium]
RVQAYDPVAMPAAKHLFPADWFRSGQLHFSEHQYEALNKADALVLVTEWKPFCYPDLTVMKKVMRKHIILDGRNQYDPKQLKDAGFDYYGIGRE